MSKLRPTSRYPRHNPRRLWQLQRLEDRTVPNSFVVTLSSDSNTPDPVFPASKGDLRYVLGLANNNGVADDITFDASVTSISLSALTGQLVISEAQGLLINGGGAVTIKSTAAQGASSRVFNISAVGTSIDLKGLTLTGGDLSSGNNGGAILFTNEALTLTNCLITGNKTAGAGGALATATDYANLTLNNSTISYNSANTTGGGLNLGKSASVTVNGTTFNGNTAASHGGGINGATTLTLDIANSTFINNTSGGNGGAIATSSGSIACSITLTNCTLSNNIASTISSNGGAVSMNGPATFSATDSTIRDNVSINNGGGLRFANNNVSATLTRCSVTGNIGGVGGGVSLDSPSPGAQLNVFESTIANNQSLGFTKSGGAIFTSSGSISIRNSTLSGNTAFGTQGGGAIEVYSAGFSGTISVNSTTLTNNKAPYGKGGGLFMRGSPGTVEFNNSILAGNSAAAGPDLYYFDASGSNPSRNIGGDYNLVGTNENTNMVFTGAIGNQIGTSDTMPINPMLAPLATNGGIGLSHLPLTGSPVINAGSTTVTFDQLGQARSAMTDIGAVEWHTKPPTAKATLSNVTVSGSTYTATVVYSDDTAIDSASIDITDVALSGPGYAVPVAPISAMASGVGTVTAVYQFAAPGGNWTKSANGTYTLTLQSGKVFDNAMPANGALGGVLGTFQVSLRDSLVVTVATDEDDGNYAANDLSLREAIILANADPATPDVITFDSVTFNSAVTMNTGTLGQMSITGPVTITGPSKLLTLNAQQLSRHFRIDGPGQFGVTIQNIALTNGKSTDTTVAGRGGSIFVQDESLTLSNVTITNSTAANSGGAVAVSGPGNLSLLDSKLTGNSATGSSGLGGAVSMHAFYATSFTMDRSTVSGNTAERSGGGMYLRGIISIQNSTIDTNTANAATTAFIHGGGIFFGGNPAGPGWRIRNSTISGNVAKDSGGGIAFTAQNASIFIQNSTITNNTANTTSTATGTGGGGIAVATGTIGLSTITLDSTIVAGNFSGNLFDDLTTASTLNSNYSAIGVANLGGIGTANYVGGVNNTPPLLTPLGFYGGPTRTHALQSGSPMLNSGSNPSPALSFDQRGTGFPRVTGMPLQADIGAFEGITPDPGASAMFNDINNPGTMPDTITITYVDETAIDVASIGTNDITITAPSGTLLPIVGVTTIGSGNLINATYQFTIPGGIWDPVDNGTYTVTVLAKQVFNLDVPPRSVPLTVVGKFNVGVMGTLTVDTNVDESDSNFAPGDLSLREAIELANFSQFGPCTIGFDSKAFATDKIIDVNSSGLGELKIIAPMQINGPTSSKLTVTGSNVIRVFNINPAGVGGAVGLANMTITGGKTTGNLNNGAGILMADDELTLTNVTMAANASGNHGGAIYISGGNPAHLILNSSTLSNNLANTTTSTSGGAIYVNANAQIDITDSTVSNNIAGFGGAIYLNNGASLMANSSTFSGNIATNADPVGNRGGGMMFILVGSATFNDCTISGNKATGRSGGAILVSSFNSSLMLNNTTVAFNEAVDAGGAIMFTFPGQVATFFSSIIAKNTAAGSPNDITTQPTFNINGTNNLIGVGDGLTIDPNNLVGTIAAPIDPLLGPLANNGGPTFTHALLNGSPAIDQGYNVLGTTTLPNDQRGKNRTVDHPDVTGTLMNADGSDIGSFELQSPPTAKVLVNGAMGGQRSLVKSIKVSFSEAVSFPMGLASAFKLERYGKAPTTGTVGFDVSPSNGPTTDVTITFNNSGAVSLDPNGSLQDGQYKLTIFATKVQGVFGTLDGDGDMTAEGSPIDDQVTSFHRLFGDADGDGNVTSTDFATFRSVFGLSGASIFDYNGDNNTNSNDFAEFRKRFGLNGYLP